MAKILVVEDDLTNLEIIVRYLEISKFEVITAANGPDQSRAPSTQNAIAGPITIATTAQASSDARW